MPQISLASGPVRLLALLVGWGVLAGAAWGVVREFQAARARSAEDRQTLERALLLAEDDAALHYRLGQWEQFSLPDGSQERALAHYRRAAELNPYESRYALDLADLLLDQGDSAAAAAALHRALRADPHTPRTLWRAGNFWLRAGQPQRAVPYLRRVLSAEPGLAPLVIQAAHRTLGDARVVLRDVLPAEPRVLLAYLRHLVAVNQAEDAARVWQALVGLERPFELRPALAYVDFLIRTGQVGEAEKAWSDLKRVELLAGHTAPRAEGERLHNPRLQHPVLNGGFGWRVLPAPGVSAALGAGPEGQDASALVLSFQGQENLHYRQFFQFVPVEPNRRYRFQAWLRTENITTESGPRLEVADADLHSGRVARSPGLVGTHDWVLEQAEFEAGPDTRLLRVGLVRLPSRRVSNQIRGTVRAARFSLRAVE